MYAYCPDAGNRSMLTRTSKLKLFNNALGGLLDFIRLELPQNSTRSLRWTLEKV
jgi:hypothetical protein